MAMTPKQYHRWLQKWTAIGMISGFLLGLPLYRYAFMPNLPWELALRDVGLIVVIMWLLLIPANWLLYQRYKRNET